jgi:hypothetical protein
MKNVPQDSVYTVPTRGWGVREVLKHPFARLRNSILCRRDVSPVSAWQVIGWWEARRIPFNLVVGIAGLLSCIAIAVVGVGSFFLFNSDFGSPGSPLGGFFFVLIYGIGANIFFTGVWIAELIVRKLWPIQADRFATITYSLGVIFAVLLTVAPGIIVGAVGVFEVIRHILGVFHHR